MQEQGVEISSTQSIIDDARNGKMFILVDHEERENEGDLVIPGQMATPNAVNFMFSAVINIVFWIYINCKKVKGRF